MKSNIWYLVSAIFSKLKNNPSQIDGSVWKLIIAGLVGMVIYIAGFIYFVYYLWTLFK